MEPLNLTTAQKEQYKGLDHTKNDCMFNALFVHLPKEKQELFRDVQGMRVATAQHIKANPKIYNDLYIYQEKLRQIAPAEVPRVGFLIPLVQAGLAAWTVYHLWKTGRDIVNDPKVQESWEERKYINTLIYSAGYLPVVGDSIHFSDALKVGNYRDAGLHAANVLFTLYVGQVIGKGGRWLSNRVRSNVVGQLGGRGGLAKRGGGGGTKTAVKVKISAHQLSNETGSRKIQGKSFINGTQRAAEYGKSWNNASLKNAIEKFTPEVKGIKVSNGKTIYFNKKNWYSGCL